MCAWTAPRTWATGEVVTASLMNTHVRDNLNALDQHAHTGAAGDGSSLTYGVTKIAENEVTGSAVASISFSSIPATYRALWIIGHVIPSTAGGAWHLRMNGDTGANYDWAASTAGLGTSAAADTEIQLSGSTAADNNTASIARPVTLYIHNYAETVLYASATWLMGFVQNGGAVFNDDVSGAGAWLNTAAVTQLTFYNSAGNTAVGTYLTIYGITA